MKRGWLSLLTLPLLTRRHGGHQAPQSLHRKNRPIPISPYLQNGVFRLHMMMFSAASCPKSVGMRPWYWRPRYEAALPRPETEIDIYLQSRHVGGCGSRVHNQGIRYLGKISWVWSQSTSHTLNNRPSCANPESDPDPQTSRAKQLSEFSGELCHRSLVSDHWVGEIIHHLTTSESQVPHLSQGATVGAP